MGIVIIAVGKSIARHDFAEVQGESHCLGIGVGHLYLIIIPVIGLIVKAIRQNLVSGCRLFFIKRKF